MASSCFLPSSRVSDQALGVADGSTQSTSHRALAVLAPSPERTGGKTVVPRESYPYAPRFPVLGGFRLHLVESLHIYVSSAGLLHP